MIEYEICRGFDSKHFLAYLGLNLASAGATLVEGALVEGTIVEGTIVEGTIVEGSLAAFLQVFP